MADVEAPPKAGSKPDAVKDVPKSELKADLKALAGKPASKSEQIHDDQNVASKQDPEGSKPRSSSTAVKKVVVEADDDEESTPAEVARLEASKEHAAEVACHHASARQVQFRIPTMTVPDENAASEPSPAGTMRGKSSSHLSASRKATDLAIREAQPTASGDRSLIRALGLKIGKIVIDPGHGGHDTGTIGPDGLQEKDLVLEVGRRLGKLLRLGWALKSSTRARTIRLFRSKLAPPSPTSSAPTCLFRSTPTRATIRPPAAWKPTT